MSFTEETVEFLVINRLTDSKPWFQEHREEYLRLVKEPLTEVCEALAPCIMEIDPMLVTLPSRCISRIYRDTRFSHDKTTFRDYMWVSFDRDHKEFPNAPGFFFSVGPYGWDYGCGFYEAPTRVMQAMRDMILAGDPDAAAAMKAFRNQKEFKMTGKTYVRSRYPDESADKREWLDRRDISFVCAVEEYDELADDAVFIPRIEKGFRTLVPMYEFLMKCVHRSYGGM